MRRLTLVSLGLVLMLAAIPAAADHPGSATDTDLWRLQDDLDSLDQALETLRPSHPQYQALKDRVEEIREEVIYVKVLVRRHERDPETPGPSRRDVENLRRDITALRDDIDESPAREAGASGEGRLEAGTEIQVRLEQPLSSRTARMEDRFEATVVEAIRAEGRTVVPSGSRVRGIVQAAEAAERPAKAGRLDLTFDTLTLPGGARMEIRSRVISIKEGMDRSETAKKAGLGALLGAVLGSAVGGKEGALIGLVVGGTGGVVATKGEDVDLPAGSVLTLGLERPLTVQR